MPPIGSLSVTPGLVRALKLATIVALGGCAPEQCDDTFGPSTTAELHGRITLNSEPVPGVEMRAMDGSDVTDENGEYSITAARELPTTECLEIGTEPWLGAAEAVLLVLPCLTWTSDDPVKRLDYRYQHAPPILEITDPLQGATVPAGNVTLSASVTSDLTVNGSSPLVHPSILWTSSLDGELGESLLLQDPSSLRDVVLSAGTHEVTATFTDLLALTAADTITLVVSASSNQPPTATITSPPSGQSFPGGTSLDFAGSGEDPEDGTLTGAALVWTSSQEGQIGTGAAFSRVMAEGSHVVVLTATDSQGSSAGDTIFIHMNPVGSAGTILGRVTANGSALADVPVALSGAATANTTTNSLGDYAFDGLPAGEYTITITPPPGTDIPLQQNVTLGDGETLTVDFTG